MAGCYGNSAEDRYYEKMLDDYLDSQTDVEDIYGDEAKEIIEERYEERDGDFDDWIRECIDLPLAEDVTEETSNAIFDLVRKDKRVREKYYDARFYDVCLELMEKEEARREEADDDRYESMREERACRGY